MAAAAVQLSTVFDRRRPRPTVYITHLLHLLSRRLNNALVRALLASVIPRLLSEPPVDSSSPAGSPLSPVVFAAISIAFVRLQHVRLLPTATSTVSR
jgi:hypothetical protein